MECFQEGELQQAFGNDCSGLSRVNGLEKKYFVEAVRILLRNPCVRMLGRTKMVAVEMEMEMERS